MLMQVELLWDMYHEARNSEDRGAKAPAPALAHAPPVGASQGPGGGGAARAGGMALGTLSRLLTALRLMYSAGPDAVGDYRLAVVRWKRGGAGAGACGRGRQRCASMSPST